MHLPRHLALEFWLCNNMSVFTYVVKMVGKKKQKKFELGRLVHAYNLSCQEVMAGKQEFTILKDFCGCPWTSLSLPPPTPCLSNSSSNKTLRNGKTAKIRVPSCMSSRQELRRKERKVAASECCSLNKDSVAASGQDDPQSNARSS